MSSVTMKVQALDSLGNTTGSVISLGTLTVDSGTGTVKLDRPSLAQASATGYQVVLQELGEDGRTVTTKVFFEGAEEPPPPTPDTTAPTTPGNLRSSSITTSSFRLDWDASTDAVGVTGYSITLNGGSPVTTTGLTRTFSGLTPNTLYAVSLTARDAATNVSTAATLNVTTLAEVAPPPIVTGWPSASNTGYLGSQGLTNQNGYTVTTPGAVIEYKNITGTLVIDAANVTVRNCQINSGFFGIETTSRARYLVVEDCTVIGGGDCGIAATQSNDVIVRRNNVSGGFDGMKIAGTNVLVEDNYIHNLQGGASAHNDGIQCGSSTNLTFRHNYIAARDTSCIAMFQGQGTYNTVLVENNYLANAGYLLYSPGTTGSNIRVMGNTFVNWGWGPVSDWVVKTGNVWSGNVNGSGSPVNV